MERGRAMLVVLALASVAGQEMVKVMSGAQMRVLHVAMDLNSDGQVTPEEGSKLVRRLRASLMWQDVAPIMKSMDTNADGLLSSDELKEDLRHFKISEEHRADFASRFASFDDDGDALLSPDEAQPLFNFIFFFRSLTSTATACSPSASSR